MNVLFRCLWSSWHSHSNTPHWQRMRVEEQQFIRNPRSPSWRIAVPCSQAVLSCQLLFFFSPGTWWGSAICRHQTSFFLTNSTSHFWDIIYPSWLGWRWGWGILSNQPMRWPSKVSYSMHLRLQLNSSELRGKTRSDGVGAFRLEVFLMSS